jgi:hypothetical protein
MLKKIGIVVGIDGAVDTGDYRVIIADVMENNGVVAGFQFNLRLLSAQQVVQSFASGALWYNIKLENGKLKGSTGSLDRFKPSEAGVRPFVIISEILSEKKNLVGYKVADYNGKVMNKRLEEMLGYGNQVEKVKSIPVQNAIFVPREDGRREHFKTYPDASFFKEINNVNRNTHAVKKEAVVDDKHVTTAKERLKEIYTDAQIAELIGGKKEGIAVGLYANNKLSAGQMHMLRLALNSNCDINQLKLIAHPEFSTELMGYYIDDIKYKYDISDYVNSKYSAGQISEVSLAASQGLDLSILADPKNSPSDMAEIRERLEKNLWKDVLVNKDKSWR